MQSLELVIAAVKKEVCDALAHHQPLPNNIRLDPERVTVRLRFTIQSSGPDAPLRLNFETTEKAPTSNELTIEFKLQNAETQGVRPLEAVQQSPLKELDVAEKQVVTKQLSHVFGVPGFDSSARASVFREALENLTEPDIAVLVQALSNGPAPGTDTLRHAYSLIGRLCRAGPAGHDKGHRILARVLSKHQPACVVKLVAEVWKTQDNWL